MLSLYREAFSGINRNIWILTVATLINRTGSMVVLFTSLYLTRQLQFSLSEAGILMSFYGLGSIAGSLFGGWLTDRWNHYDILVWSLVGSGLVLPFLTMTSDFWFIGAILFSYAAIADAFRPANAASIASYSTPENRTRAVSVVRLAINLGFSIGPALGGVVALYFGYHILFYADSITSFLAAGMLAYFLPRPSKNRGNEKKENIRKSLIPFDSAYRDGLYLFFILLVAIYAIGFFQIFALMPQFFNRVCHLNEDMIGYLMAFNGLLVVFIELPLITWLQKKTVRGFQLIALGVICIPLSFLIILFFPCQLDMAFLFIFIITLSEIFAMPYMMNFSLSRPAKERQGEYSALYSVAYGVANMVAPSLGLGMAHYMGFEKTFLLMVLAFIPISMIFWYMDKKWKSLATQPK